MRALSSAELLDVWELGAALPPVQRAVALLAAGYRDSSAEDTSPEALADWSVGRRDAGLLRLREHTFGPRLAAVADCPGCGERLELAFEAEEIRAVPPPGTVGGELSLAQGGWELRFRLPTSRDLAAVAAAEDGRAALLRRCLLAAPPDGEFPGGELPDELAAAVEERMAEADPQARVLLDLTCPACRRQWQAPFEIDTYFWSELDAWARRTLREVHDLASAYGWSEAEILGMSAARRHLYLGMVGA